MWTRSTSAPHKHPAGGGPYIENSTRHNHLMNSMGPIFSCNPCGEEFLHSNNSCNLGSIDVSKVYDPDHRDRRNIDWDHLRHIVHYSTQLLCNVTDTRAWPPPHTQATL